MNPQFVDTTPASPLKPVQSAVIAALLAGQNVTAAAESAGVHRATVHNWLTDPVFRAEYERVRHERTLAIEDQFQELDALALENLKLILTDPKASPSVRLKAALAVLNRPADPLKAWTVPIPPAPRRNSTEIDTISEMRSPQTPRNAVCPCGSGEKYKRCCGKSAPPVLAA